MAFQLKRGATEAWAHLNRKLRDTIKAPHADSDRAALRPFASFRSISTCRPASTSSAAMIEKFADHGEQLNVLFRRHGGGNVSYAGKPTVLGAAA